MYKITLHEFIITHNSSHVWYLDDLTAKPHANEKAIPQAAHELFMTFLSTSHRFNLKRSCQGSSNRFGTHWSPLHLLEVMSHRGHSVQRPVIIVIQSSKSSKAMLLLSFSTSPFGDGPYAFLRRWLGEGTRQSGNCLSRSLIHAVGMAGTAKGFAFQLRIASTFPGLEKISGNPEGLCFASQKFRKRSSSRWTGWIQFDAINDGGPQRISVSHVDSFAKKCQHYWNILDRSQSSACSARGSSPVI